MLYAHPWTLTTAPSARHPEQTEPYMVYHLRNSSGISSLSIAPVESLIPFWICSKGSFLTQNLSICLHFFLSGNGTLFPSEQEGAT